MQLKWHHIAIFRSRGEKKINWNEIREVTMTEGNETIEFAIFLELNFDEQN